MKELNFSCFVLKTAKKIKYTRLLTDSLPFYHYSTYFDKKSHISLQFCYFSETSFPFLIKGEVSKVPS